MFHQTFIWFFVTFKKWNYNSQEKVMQVQIFNKTKQANIINSLILEFEQDYNIIIIDGQNGA